MMLLLLMEIIILINRRLSYLHLALLTLWIGIVLFKWERKILQIPFMEKITLILNNINY
nr:MAG TPA: hypothetical protein [Caudoviricetes sp.]DAR22355.1 MAG TPA: hypothetical protein [Caudoviricetes sp.]